MRFSAFLCLLPLVFAGPVTAAAPNLAVEAVPKSPTVHAADTTVSNPDGSQRTVKGPYLSVQIEFRNNSRGEDYTVSTIGFSLSSPTDFLEEDAQRDMRPFTLEPYLKIAPGQTATTEVFYLEGLPKASGTGHHVSVSVTGWRNTGSDAGDQFALGAGFKAR